MEQNEDKLQDAILPILPNEDERMLELALEEFKDVLMFAEEECDEPNYLLQFKGVPFSPLGGIQAITGHRKNGKSLLLTIFMSAILQSDSEQMRMKFPGLQLCDNIKDVIGHEPRVLYIDTEMEPLNTMKVIRRVHYLCGWELKKSNRRFFTMRLRKLFNIEVKKKRTLKAIDMFRATVVVIDGVRDIVKDFNDNGEASELISTLMAKATDANCCIWNALHYNPKAGNDADGKMRGHLGTEMGNKVTDTFASQKFKTAEGIFFKVTQVDARGKDVEDFTFEVTDECGHLGIPRMCDAPKADIPGKKNASEEQKKTRIEETRKALKIILPNGIAKRWQEILNDLMELQGYSELTARKRLNEASCFLDRISGDYKWFYTEQRDEVIESFNQYSGNKDELLNQQEDAPF